MNATQETTPFSIFTERFDQYHERDQGLVSFKSLLTNPVIQRMEPGQVNRGITVGGYQFIAIMSKMGPILLTVMYGTTVIYACEEQLAICHSWQQMGLSAGGMVDTLAQMQHIFAIPDSYL